MRVLLPLSSCHNPLLPPRTPQLRMRDGEAEIARLTAKYRRRMMREDRRSGVSGSGVSVAGSGAAAPPLRGRNRGSSDTTGVTSAAAIASASSAGGATVAYDLASSPPRHRVHAGSLGGHGDAGHYRTAERRTPEGSTGAAAHSFDPSPPPLLPSPQQLRHLRAQPSVRSGSPLPPDGAGGAAAGASASGGGGTALQWRQQHHSHAHQMSPPQQQHLLPPYRAGGPGGSRSNAATPPPLPPTALLGHAHPYGSGGTSPSSSVSSGGGGGGGGYPPLHHAYRGSSPAGSAGSSGVGSGLRGSVNASASVTQGARRGSPGLSAMGLC